MEQARLTRPEPPQFRVQPERRSNLCELRAPGESGRAPPQKAPRENPAPAQGRQRLPRSTTKRSRQSTGARFVNGLRLWRVAWRSLFFLRSNARESGWRYSTLQSAQPKVLRPREGRGRLPRPEQPSAEEVPPWSR